MHIEGLLKVHTIYVTSVTDSCFSLQAALFAIDLLFEKSYERKPIFVGL